MKTESKVGLFLIYPKEFRMPPAVFRDWPEYSAKGGIEIFVFDGN